MTRAGIREEDMAGGREVAGRIKMLEESEGLTLHGFKVFAADGPAGRVDQILYWSDARLPDYIVIGSGRWFFGHKSVLSVETIVNIDVNHRRLNIGLSREQIRRAPEFLSWT